MRTKLIGFGFQLLENVDPNPENFVCAAIFHSKNIQVGCLLRLEPNKQAQVSVGWSWLLLCANPTNSFLIPRCIV